ncbi:MAG: sensor histidine kinase [Haloechinothrix sp.]
MPSPGHRQRWSVARQLLVLQLVIVAVVVTGGAVLAYLEAVRATEDSAREKVTSVAVSVADSPSLLAALAEPDPSARLQPFAERVRADTDVDFITIMDNDGTRYTHPNPERIGGTFVGNTEPALAGRTFTETYTGTLGPSIRAVVPVFDRAAEVTALVSVGITVSAISAELNERLLALLAVAGAVLVVGVGGAYLVSARLRKQTRGVGLVELTRMFEYYAAILHSVREGLILVGSDGRVALSNDAARELLDLSEGDEGVAVRELGLAPALAGALVSQEPRTDEVHVTDDRVLVVNTAMVRSGERAMGNVVTVRDHTELQNLTGELQTVRGFAESLRSQAHEAANRLHTVVSLVELGRTEEAVEFATTELAAAQQLTDRVMDAVSDPVLAAVLLGKSAEAGERGIELVLTPDTSYQEGSMAGAFEPRDLVTVLGNLIDNAMDAAGAGDSAAASRVTVTVRGSGAELLMRVADTGAGITPDSVANVFRRGWSTKASGGPIGHGLGLALVGQAVRRYGGSIEVDRDDGAVFTVRLPMRTRAGEGA